ncbi:MAG: fibronectin type III domain-containing protein, partial [Treponema porcinum]|nr:fibronectin type III domain-containing protein [Treponema porcinum]
MKKNFVLYIAVVSFCLFLSGCKVSVSSSYETKLLAPKNFAVKEGKGCVMLVWDLPEENTSEDVEYFVEYDGKTVPVDKSACCKKISGLQNGTEYTFTLYGQKMQSGKKGYVSTAKATPSEDGIDMADSVHQGYVVWFNLYERKDKKTLVAKNTNDGRIVWPSEIASAYDQNRDVSAYEDNYTEVEKLIVRVPSNITGCLR